jgi:hypothetical protein
MFWLLAVVNEVSKRMPVSRNRARAPVRAHASFGVLSGLGS